MWDAPELLAFSGKQNNKINKEVNKSIKKNVNKLSPERIIMRWDNDKSYSQRYSHA